MELMPGPRPITVTRVFTLLAALLIWRVTGSVVYEYRNYFPPNFATDFLRGREAYFWGPYRWAFYVHLVSGPISLLLGTVLISDRLRARWPKWHRRLGRVQGINVLLLVAPSGLWMARYAVTGAIAGAGLGALSIAAAVCVTLGWRAAMQRRYVTHQRWMERTFVLLCSAVVIRIIGGLATVTNFDAEWLYPASCWGSWLLPLVIYEWFTMRQPREQQLATMTP